MRCLKRKSQKQSPKEGFDISEPLESIASDDKREIERMNREAKASGQRVAAERIEFSENRRPSPNPGTVKQGVEQEGLADILGPMPRDRPMPRDTLGQGRSASGPGRSKKKPSGATTKSERDDQNIQNS